MSEGFYTIVEFTAFESFYGFDRKDKKKIKRTENHKIKVTIEVNFEKYTAEFCNVFAKNYVKYK